MAQLGEKNTMTVLDAEAQFQANMAFLGNHPIHREMYEQIHACPITNMKLMPTASGQLYGEVFDMQTQQWSALCHPEDPREQARVSCDQFYTPQARVFCMIGLGLGYNAVEFATRLKPYQRLVIWDIDAQMFKAMLSAVDITPLFTLPNVNLILGSDVPSKVEEWWLSLQTQDKLAIQMPMREGYTQTYLREQYDVLMQKTMDMVRFTMVGMSTWKIFGRCIGDNDLLNLPDYFANPGYEHLKDLWKDKPAVCIAAGPSLQKNLRLLLPPTIRRQIALLTVGTCYALIQGLGLAPDVTTTIDFQRLNFTDQFQYIPLDPDAPLVYLHSTYGETIRHWAGPRFVAENASDTVTWLRRYGEGKASAAEVQTVAHLNLKVALMLGANPIILLGQDLSMPYEQHHAAGARAQDQCPSETTPEAWITVPDFEGKPVQTRHSFLSMLTVFERLVAENPGTTFLNCSEAGLAIKGADNVPLAHALRAIQHPDNSPQGPTGETTLRDMIKKRYHAYTPTVSPELRTDLDLLYTQVQELQHCAQTIYTLEATRSLLYGSPLSPDQERARLAADAQSDIEMIEDMQEIYDQRICAHEAEIFTKRSVAWALFAIRRFDFLELLAEAPPPDDAVANSHAQWRYNAERLSRVARMIDEESAHILSILGTIKRRLVTPNHLSLSQRAMRRFMRDKRAWNLSTLTQRLLAQQCFHTQQYDACLALLPSESLKAKRIQCHLDKYRANVRTAMPAYFPKEPSQEPATPSYGVYY